MSLDAGVEEALAAIPAGGGVAQVLGPGERSLLVGRAADLRRWVATQLGRGPSPKRKGARPPVDLSPIACAVAWAEAAGPFGQRLLYERLMAPLVPIGERRDLKAPAWLHLDPGERFPRVTVRADGPPDRLYGAFREGRIAARARDALHKATRLRPCDFSFEPAADLALGLSCLYAQVDTCAAPCLCRIGEDAYRELAADLARALGGETGRGDAIARALPAWTRRADGRSLVVEPQGDRLALYPLVGRSVREERAREGPRTELDALVAALDWSPAEHAPDDTPWLMAWRHAPRRGAVEVVVRGGEAASAVAARVRDALDQPAPPRRREGADTVVR